MSQGDGDRTVLRPTPGGARPQGAGAPPPPPPSGPALAPEALIESARGINPLVDGAAVLLALLVQLRQTQAHADPDGLRARLINEVRAFERRAQQHESRPEIQLAATYCLSSALDEAVLRTPWGAACGWSTKGLLVTLHNETWGGEKFFLVLERLERDPARNLEILELLYLVLRLGFEGKYQVVQNGRAELEAVGDRVLASIRRQRGEHERQLSPHWRIEAPPRRGLTHFVPLWVVGAVAGALLVCMYLGFRVILEGQADPTQARLEALAQAER